MVKGIDIFQEYFREYTEILLNDAYYRALLEGREIMMGISV